MRIVGNRAEKNKFPCDIVRVEDIDYTRTVKVARSAIKGKAILSGGVLTEWRKEWMYGSKKDY